MHEQPFANFVPPIEETARFCGMNWEDPVIIHGAHLIDETALAAYGSQLATRLQAWTKRDVPATAAAANPDGARQ
jgi:glutathione-regulated potassium-efflux system ancillary protein KefF